MELMRFYKTHATYGSNLNTYISRTGRGYRAKYEQYVEVATNGDVELPKAVPIHISNNLPCVEQLLDTYMVVASHFCH